MANTFYNTGMATSNPQLNVQQSQPVQNQQATEVSPITIPIQIQPQVAQTGQPQITQPNRSLQTVQQNQPVQQAPKPQTYQQPAKSNNINFNNIYQAYQSQYGTNVASSVSSGVRKTFLGTTIVTPTTSNLNSVEGQYQSAYADTINGLIGEILNRQKTGFQYDPTQDTNLRLASEYAASSAMEQMAARGILNSSSTAERVASVVSELIPKYEQLAYTRWTDALNQLSNTAQLVMNYDHQQFEYWKDAKDREFKNKQFEYQKQQDAITNAWKRVDELGYVDNNASTVLGVKVGTLSGEARRAKEEREFQLAKMREQAQIEYENTKALYRIKSDIEVQQQKLITENNYKLQQKYETTKSNTTSLNTYKDIINNRFTEYDDTNKRYNSIDNNGLYNYLVTEYSAGRMSSSDLANLTAMYNVTQPTSNDSAKQARIAYLNSLK